MKDMEHKGSINGYMKHQRRKEPACAPCKAAWAEYYRLRRHDATRQSKRDDIVHPLSPEMELGIHSGVGES